MKLLIIDDERRTREGILRSLDWDELGIDSFFQADDGLKGLEITKREHPEIILSDIRMPRMDGIMMAEQIHTLYPYTCIIFMSGYSDKEYLKAAIRLRAVRYVEKPIDISELKDAVSQTIKTLEAIRQNKHTQRLHHHEAQRKLALSVLQERIYSQEECSAATATMQLKEPDHTWFTTVLLQLKTPLSHLETGFLQAFYYHVAAAAAACQLQEIHGEKSEHLIVFHFYRSCRFSSEALLPLYHCIQAFLYSHCHFFLAPGPPVYGFRQICQSYRNAVILLQSSFFNDYDVILEAPDQTSATVLTTDDTCKFAAALAAREEEACLKIIAALYQNLKESCHLLPGQVRDIYYKYFFEINSMTVKSRTVFTPEANDGDSLWSSISACATLHELHLLLHNRLQHFFLGLAQERDESTTIFFIKNFIHKNYSSEALSIPAISDQVFMTPSYVCTLFKHETGKTLNQYITGYRMEIAKQLLSDSRYRIADIGTKVGYSDGNYFGKLFKKMTGLTPGEYRQKALS